MVEYGAVSPNFRPKETGTRWSTILMGVIGCGLILAVIAVQPRAAATSAISHSQRLALAKQQALQEGEAAAAEPAAAGGEQPAGTGKELVKSVEEAVTEKPTEANSHYIKGYNDKEVHLLIILLLILVPGGIYMFWRTQKRLNERGDGHALFDTDKVTEQWNKGLGDFGDKLGEFGSQAKDFGSGLATQAGDLASKTTSHLSEGVSKLTAKKEEPAGEKV